MKNLIFLFALLSLMSCRNTKSFTSSERVDSAWTVQKVLELPVNGGKTQGVNLSLAYGQKIGSAPALQMPLAQYINKTYVVQDDRGRAELKYWLDERGEMWATCEAKDTVIQALVEEKNRLIKDHKVQTKTIYKTPGWVRGLGVGLLLVVVGVIVFVAIKVLK